MTVIEDREFVETLYRRFCRRPIRDAADRRAVRNRQMRVQLGRPGVWIISIHDFEPGYPDSLIDIGWNGAEAWAMKVHAFDERLASAPQPSFSRFVKKFLLKHQAIAGMRGAA